MSSSQTLLSSGEAAQAPHPLRSMFDLRVAVEVMIGTASISVRDCLTLRPRSVIQLREQAGADLTLSLNGVPLATGEVVIVDDSTAVRVSDITEPSNGEPA